ncbi:hypothetical protein DDB_G0271332 [Dictyostelium discoideum AX4]|uniref:Uncharacterized protein n=1 Tax=Dictyostelium discoideum TaxID=44689 RepID=Q55BH1_DICDI|nr:hypothetical protein DDB_G0271332 [Dictyostelium discoideum AX4]EAL71796.1 hypothetical protein DDB_G0271332 [Dictyostelium discoideum AX4]|eukprot:XP_645641.1 hypothetical protein DDB_G0271332 [Dictyostelium discoideum AX4]
MFYSKIIVFFINFLKSFLQKQKILKTEDPIVLIMWPRGSDVPNNYKFFLGCFLNYYKTETDTNTGDLTTNYNHAYLRHRPNQLGEITTDLFYYNSFQTFQSICSFTSNYCDNDGQGHLQHNVRYGRIIFSYKVFRNLNSIRAGEEFNTIDVLYENNNLNSINNNNNNNNNNNINNINNYNNNNSNNNNNNNNNNNINNNNNSINNINNSI